MHTDLDTVAHSIDVDHLVGSLDVTNFAPILEPSQVSDFFEDLSRQFAENLTDTSNHHTNVTSEVNLDSIKPGKFKETINDQKPTESTAENVTVVEHNHNYIDLRRFNGNGYALAATVEREVTQFQCYLCHHQFKRFWKLETHMQTHTEKKPFKCFCDRRFARKIFLQMHLRVHIGKTIFRCADCGKRKSRESKCRKVKKSRTWRY